MELKVSGKCFEIHSKQSHADMYTLRNFPTFVRRLFLGIVTFNL